MPTSKPAKMRRHQRSTFLARVALATCTCIAAVEAGNRIVFDSIRPLVTTRLDPIIFPGAISQHIHRVIGGNNFNAVYDPKQYRNSTCSSMAPQADMSNYWHPTLYKVILQPDGSSKYSPMWGQTRIYYNFPSLKTGTGPGTYVEPFPEYFEMVAGNPAKKTGGGYSQEDLSVFYYCERDYKNGTVVGYSTYDLPKFGCSFLTTKVWFPSCWNGQAFDLSNPYGHVKYPNIGAGLTGPNCPVGYERRIPSILVETFYFGYGTSGWMQWYQGPGDEFGGNGNLAPTYILANGDTTGYGLHADFANGWNQTVLQQVVTQCLNTNGDLRADQACPPLAPSWNQTTANNCHLSTNTQVADEVVGWDGPLDALPGCNLPWGLGSKPTCAGYKERRWANWGRLIGPELNEEPTLAEVANDPFGLNSTTSTTITSNVPTSVSTSTSMSLDTNQTTLTIPTTVISVPSTTIISNASPTLIAPTNATGTGLTSGAVPSTTDVSLTRGQDGTTIIDVSSPASSSTLPGSTNSSSTALTSTAADSTSTLPSTSLVTSSNIFGSGTSSIATTSKVSTTSQATTTSKAATTSKPATTSNITTKVTTTSKVTTTTKAASTTSKAATTTTKPATTSKVTTTSKAATTTSKAATTSKPATTTSKVTTTTTTTSKVTTTTKPATTTSKVTTTTKPATTTSKVTTTSKPATTSTTSKVTTTSTTSKAATTTSLVSSPSNIFAPPPSSASTGLSSTLDSSSSSLAPSPSSDSTILSSTLASASDTSAAASSSALTDLPSTSVSSGPASTSSTSDAPVAPSSSIPVFVSTTSSKVVLAPGRGGVFKPSTSSKLPTSTLVPAPSSTSESSIVSPPLASLTSASSSSIPLFSTTTVGLAMGRGRGLLKSSTSPSSQQSSLIQRDSSTSPAFISSLTSPFEGEYSITSSVKLKPMRGIATM